MSGDDKDTTRIRQTGSQNAGIPRKYQASIVIMQGYAKGMEYPVTKEYTVLGRDKSADIMLKDPLISRQHAAILYQDGEFKLKDLGSTNGTVMNGALIEVASIRHRDKFRMGETTIQLIIEETGEGDTYEIYDE